MNDSSPPIDDPVVDDPSSSSSGSRLTEWQHGAELRLAQARAWIRENPLPAIGIAVAAGFVVGRIIRR